MLTIRRADERGHADHGWLKTNYTFSFADYHDPRFMGFRVLRVMNDDRIAPGRGFGTHPHRDMEIITYVLEGSLAHRDSLGSSGVVRAGELQRITAGTGISHSEFNASPTEPVHLYQIWIVPDRRGWDPSYEQRTVDEAETRGTWRLVASPDGRLRSLTIHQDAYVFLSALGPEDKFHVALAPGRHAWLQVLRGRVECNGQALGEGDGVAITNEPKLTLNGGDPSEVLYFDLP